ncbi:hypothetical protein TKK_0005052 [Trichogramma kaykai]
MRLERVQVPADIHALSSQTLYSSIVINQEVVKLMHSAQYEKLPVPADNCSIPVDVRTRGQYNAAALEPERADQMPRSTDRAGNRTPMDSNSIAGRNANMPTAGQRKEQAPNFDGILEASEQSQLSDSEDEQWKTPLAQINSSYSLAYRRGGMHDNSASAREHRDRISTVLMSTPYFTPRTHVSEQRRSARAAQVKKFEDLTERSTNLIVEDKASSLQEEGEQVDDTARISTSQIDQPKAYCNDGDEGRLVDATNICENKSVETETFSKNEKKEHIKDPEASFMKVDEEQVDITWLMSEEDQERMQIKNSLKSWIKYRQMVTGIPEPIRQTEAEFNQFYTNGEIPYPVPYPYKGHSYRTS